VLNAMLERWPDSFVADDVAKEINSTKSSFNSNSVVNPIFSGMLQGFFYPTMQHDLQVSNRSVGKQLRKHVNNPVKYTAQQVLILRSRSDHSAVRGSLEYFIEAKAV
jgi:hypothetical protein